MSDPRELATATIDAALPPMLEVIVHDFHTPDRYSNSDKLKAVELFMKAKGMLQQDKQPQLLSVDINFISADGVAYSSEQQTVVLDMPTPKLLKTNTEQPAELMEPLEVLQEPDVEQQEKVAPSADPFADLETLLEGL